MLTKAKETKDITINGNVVRFLHVRKGEENKASVVIESKKKEVRKNGTSSKI